MACRILSRYPSFYKLFVCLLYALPIIFSLVSIFFITTSGEDIFQGASNLTNGNNINVIQDASNAFTFNSRITDMYTWAVIDFYDYQFNFGPDFIFRIIDVIMIVAVFYFSTYLVLAHKPKLRIKDALIFCALFVAFIVTPFGYTFYREFSMIHNYVPLTLVTLIFSIPYIKLATKQPTKKYSPSLFSIIMLIVGIIFGMSATITPLAFLITVIIFCTIRRKNLTKPPVWFFTGLIGTIIGFLICWLAGSGIDHYTNTSSTSTFFDYIPFKDVFANIPKLIFHNIYNFALVLAPLLAVIILLLFFIKNPKRIFSKTHLTHLSPSIINIFLVFAFFIIVHILGASFIKAPPRLLIPAYLAGLIIIFRLVASHLKYNNFFIYTIAAITLVVVLTHSILIIKYHSEMSQTLSTIKHSDNITICIDPSDTKPTRIPLLDLSQANMLVDWNMPEPIYDKQIITCE